jgi:hypothetical protein
MGLAYAQTSPPKVNICEVIKNPLKWQHKMILVDGFGTISQLGGPLLFSLVAIPPETCKYPDSEYSSSTEPARVLLEWPDNHFRENPPSGFKVDASFMVSAYQEMRKLRVREPYLSRVRATLSAYVLVRKYRLPVTPAGGRRPAHVPSPVVLIVESYKSVQLPTAKR